MLVVTHVAEQVFEVVEYPVELSVARSSNLQPFEKFEELRNVNATDGQFLYQLLNIRVGQTVRD